MPRPWGLKLLHWATQQKCLWMCVLRGNTPTVKSERFCQSELPAKLVLFLFFFLKSLSAIFQIKIKEEVKASLYSQFMPMGIIILHLNKTERSPWSLRRILESTHRLVCAGTVKNELINCKHCIHFKPIPGPRFCKQRQKCRSGQHRNQKFSWTVGNRGRGTQGKGQRSPNYSAQVHSDGADKWQNTYTQS